MLGEVRAVDQSREVNLRPVERRLLAALVVGRSSVVRYESLADAVWGSRVPRSAKHALQAHVRRVRESVGDGIIRTASGGYQLGSGVTVDVDAFEATIEAATSSSEADAVTRWEEALSWWRGTPFEEIGDWAPAESERVRLVELWHRAEEELCAAALATSPSPSVVAEAERLAHLEPLRERRWALVMTALHATGRRAEALRTFDRARRTLATELGISPGTELIRLHQLLLDDDDEPDPGQRTRPRTGRLPTAVSSIVGRDELLTQLGTHFGDGRVVTLIGPGGVGKTRLALEYAARRRSEVSGGGWWVDLAATRQAEAVEPVIASTLGIGVNIGTTREQIIGAIGDRHLLLVIDNCEHVLAPVTALVTEVLAACPRVEVLATSREPLAVAGERTVGVPALPVDGSAVELFVARAREADPAFTADDFVALAAVSRRLDGLPLAIELAAARVRTLGLTDLAARLDDRFDLLSAARRGPDTRYHTMRAALDWSYDLLDPTERVVFEQLAVFRGRFELEAVESVVSAAPDHAAVTLASLVDKSMVVADGAGPARFRVLEPLRQYADERLHASGHAGATASCHAAYYAELAARLAIELRGRGEIETARRLDDARDNFRAAFNTALDNADATVALAIPVHLTRYAANHVWGEPWVWSLAALGLPGASNHPLRPATLLAVAQGAWQHEQHAQALEVTHEVIAVVEPGGEPWREAHRLMAAALVWLGRFDEADTAATLAVSGQRAEITDATLTRTSTFALVHNLVGRTDPDVVRRLVDDAMTYGNPTCLALAWHTAGVILGRDDPGLGLEYQRNAAELASTTGAVLIEGFALAVLAAATADHDPLAGARAQVDVMRHYLRVGNRAHLRSFGRGLLRPLVALQAYEAAAIVDGATRTQPELGELAADRAVNTTAAKSALGASSPRRRRARRGNDRRPTRCPPRPHHRRHHVPAHPTTG